MGRPKKQNPKNRHIGIVTTEEKFRRFKALGLVGDEAIDVLLYHLENDKTSLNVKRMQTISNIKKIDKDIEELQYQKLKEETKLEGLNEEIGINKNNGLRNDVDQAVKTVLQRYNRVKEIYTIYDFFDMNEKLLEDQAYLSNISVDELKGLIHESI